MRRKEKEEEGGLFCVQVELGKEERVISTAKKEDSILSSVLTKALQYHVLKAAAAAARGGEGGARRSTCSPTVLGLGRNIIFGSDHFVGEGNWWEDTREERIK